MRIAAPVFDQGSLLSREVVRAVQLAEFLLQSGAVSLDLGVNALKVGFVQDAAEIIKGKEYLRALGKYYTVDMGLRNYLLGYREGDSWHILENIIYFELVRQGYGVAIGKIDNQKIGFIAMAISFALTCFTADFKPILFFPAEPLRAFLK